MRPPLLLAAILATLTTSAQVPSYVPTDGLVAWFPFNGNAADATNNGHDGTIEGATPATDRFSNSEGAYFFDGDDRIFPANPEGFPLQERTISIWMKSSLVVSGGRALMGYGGTNCGNSWLLTYNNQGNLPYSSNSFEIQGHCNNNSVAAPLNSEETTNWHLIVVRTSANGTDVLIDGLLGEHSSAFIDDTAPGCAVFGGIPSTTGECIFQDSNVSVWNGWLDDIGIWERALSDEEITALYNAPPPMAGCTDPNACNPDPNANLDDGSCEFGCLYCGTGTVWNPVLETCVAALPEFDISGDCTLFNLQELAEGYQILLAENAELNSLLAECDDTYDPLGPCSGEDVVTYHGYDYDIVEIGDQCWFAENLRNSSYSDGSTINHVPSTSDWANQTSGAWVAYDNDTQNSSTFGNLYNWFAVNSALGICPADWHVASDSEWLELDALAGIPPGELNGTGNRGAGSGAGTKWKASFPDWNGTDDFGFKGIPGGVEHEHGGFQYLLEAAYWWTGSEGNATNAWRRSVGPLDTIDRRTFDKRAGMSVRCVKD